MYRLTTPTHTFTLPEAAAASAETTMFNANYTMLFVYDSTRIEGGAWVLYRGYNSNDNTIGYQIRHNSSTLVAADKFVRYRLLFTSADNTKLVPANTSTSTNATATRTVNTTPIDPFGPIYYYSSTTAISAGGKPGAATLWQQYACALGYSFNNTGAALTLTVDTPVYIQCTPNANGSAVMNGYVQTLPNTADGKIYIYLGIAYSATQVELSLEHPVFEYKDSAIRLYTNAATGGGGTSDYTALTNKPSINGVTLTGNKTTTDLGLDAVWEDVDSDFTWGVKVTNHKAYTNGQFVYIEVELTANEYDYSVATPPAYLQSALLFWATGIVMCDDGGGSLFNSGDIIYYDHSTDEIMITSDTIAGTATLLYPIILP